MADNGRGNAEATAQPRVDVVVVTYNTAALTAGMLRRLLDTVVDVDLRVLVHDNASEDGTVDRLASEVPEAEVEAGAENVGFARGVNRALERVTAPYVLLLNSDACPEAAAVSGMLRTLRSQPQAAAVVPRLVRPTGSVEHSTHPFPSLAVAALTATGLARALPSVARRLCLEGAWHHDETRVVDWAVGAAMLIPAGVLDEIGGLDERFFMYAEDLEWCWRVADAGRSIVFDADARVVHVGAASASKRFRDRERIFAHLGNTYTVLDGRWSRGRVVLYRALQAVGCARLWAIARVRRRPAEMTRWRNEFDVHVGRPC